MVLTLRRTGRVDATRPKVFLSFFLEDKASAPDVFSSCSFIPCTQFESRLVDGQFCMVTRYDVIRSGGQPFFIESTFFFNFLNNKSNYSMAKPVLGKSVRSDWFLLGRDFAVRTVSMEMVQDVYFRFGAKPANSKFATTTAKKKCGHCHSSSRNYQKKLKRLKFYWDFKDGWRRRTFAKRVQ